MNCTCLNSISPKNIKILTLLMLKIRKYIPTKMFKVLSHSIFCFVFISTNYNLNKIILYKFQNSLHNHLIYSTILISTFLN